MTATTTIDEPRILCRPEPGGAATYSATKEQWARLVQSGIGPDTEVGKWVELQIGSLDDGQRQTIFLTRERADVVARHWPDAEPVAPRAFNGDPIPDEAVMSWNGRPVVACPSAAGEGVRNLYAGGALVGVLRDDGGQFRVLYRRGHADEPKWVRPAETAHDTLKEAARAVLE